jgi:hypothetical protein
MPINSRRIIPNTIGQGKNEEISYKIDFTKWCRNGNPPTIATVQLLRQDTGADVTVANCTGASSILGNEITTPSIHSLLPDIQYRLNVRGTIDGNILEAWVIIVGEE